MPTKESQFVLNTLRANRKLFARLGEGMMRLGGSNPALATLPMLGTQGRSFQVGEIPALWITPSQAVSGEARLILHCHGGAYMSGGLLQARAIASKVCAVTGIPVLTFAYRLAPAHPYPAALEDGLAVYQHALSLGYTPQRMALTGESAGGNLCLILCKALQAQKQPLPAGLGLMSPWTDLAQTGPSYKTLKGVDATLDGPSLYQAALDYAGSPQRLYDPMISPVYGDFHGFPPTLIHAGTHELLLSDAEALMAAMKRDGVAATLVRWEGMCHVFQAFGFPESRMALRALGDFLLQLLPQHSQGEMEGHGRGGVS